MGWQSQITALFALKAHQPTWRSSLFGMVCTGTPFIAGLILQRPIDGMLASILGMLMMLNDFGGDLRQRLQGQAILLVALLIGSCLSTLIYWGAAHDAHWHDRLLPFVIVLLCFTFFAGWVQGSGKLLESFSRNIALALIVVTEIPHVDTTMKLFFVGSAALSIMARVIDHWMVPRPKDPEILPIDKNFSTARDGSNAGKRYASVYSICIVSGLLLGVFIGTSKPYWVAITVMMTMRPDAELNFTRSMQRIVGTLIGISVAALTVHYIHDVWYIAVIVLLIGLALPHGFPLNYGVHCTLLALFVMLLYTVATAQYGGEENILRERVYDVLLGCAIALIGNAIAFPRKKVSNTDEEA